MQGQKRNTASNLALPPSRRSSPSPPLLQPQGYRLSGVKKKLVQTAPLPAPSTTDKQRLPGKVEKASSLKVVLLKPLTELKSYGVPTAFG